MNQDEVVKVILKKNSDGQDVLEFDFKHKKNIILTNDNMNDLKTFFEALLLELSEKVFKLELSFEEGYDTKLYKDVSKEYIDSLNNEIVDLLETDEWNEVFNC